MSKLTKKDVGATVHGNGVTFRVWAPFGLSVNLMGAFSNWSTIPMVNENDGYWSVDYKGAKAGQEYKFVIQTKWGELLRNDPRCLQITTSTGNSVIIDTSFDWGDDNFKAAPLNRQIIYEMHIGTFNRPDSSTPGTFDTAIEKLDYLVELGINMVELMPICTMLMDRGWGYAPDYIYAVESLYGGRHGLLNFIKAAHSKGIGVVLDVVYNHLGPDSSLDLWKFDGWSENDKGGIYFYNDWRAETPWGDARPDYGRPEVRQYILDNVRMWLLDCRLDGLRVDSTIYVRNVKGQNDDPANDLADGWGLLQQITNLGRKIDPDILLIAEDIAYNEFITKPTIQGGTGFSAQWEVTFPHLIRKTLDGANVEAHDITNLAGHINHRYNGDAWQRVIYSDSHDSAANGGFRLNEEISPGDPTGSSARKRLLIANAVVMTIPGMPMLFQGQEFMAGGSFNDWEGLKWENAQTYEGIVLAHSHLAALRKNKYGNTNGLTGQNCNVFHVDEVNKVIAYHRYSDGGPKDDVVVIVNFANRVMAGYKLNFPRDGQWNIRFNSAWKGYSSDFKTYDVTDLLVEDNSGVLTVPPYSVIILSQES